MIAAQQAAKNSSIGRCQGRMVLCKRLRVSCHEAALPAWSLEEKIRGYRGNSLGTVTWEEDCRLSRSSSIHACSYVQASNTCQEAVIKQANLCALPLDKKNGA